jgi:hypothetical protein
VRRIPAAVLALALWTLFVWAVRIRNAEGAVGPTLLAISFVALAVAVLVTRGGRVPTLALAGWTVAVWSVRVVDIALLSDHDAAFVLVHATLAAVSVALSVVAARSQAAEAEEVGRVVSGGSRRRGRG